MKTMKDTPGEVADKVRRNLHKRQTLTSIGRMFGVSPERIRQVLDGSSYMSAKWGQRFSDAFGFDLRYLLSGEGDLLQAEGTVSVELAKEYCSLRDIMEEKQKRWEAMKDSSVFSLKEKNEFRRSLNAVKLQYGKVSRRFYSEIGYVGFATSEETWETECRNRDLKELLKDMNKI